MPLANVRFAADDVDVGGFDNLEETFATNGVLVGNVVRFMLLGLRQFDATNK